MFAQNVILKGTNQARKNTRTILVNFKEEIMLCPKCNKKIVERLDKDYIIAYEMCEECFIKKQRGENED